MMIASANVPGERETLIEIYNDQRKTLLVTLDGVSEADSRKTAPDNDLTLGGLVKYLTNIEKYWITIIAEANPDAVFDADGDHKGYQLDDGETFAQWLSEYDAQAQRTDDFIATVPDLDLLIPVPVASWDSTRQFYTVRRILLHLFRETAQHSGHADLIRDAIDGQSATAPLATGA